MLIAPDLVRMLDKKNRQFLVKPAGTWYCFSERSIGPALELFMGDARPETSALRAANDSEMAPQAIEIAQNGLGQIRQLGVAG
jgi:hypothetical protein